MHMKREQEKQNGRNLAEPIGSRQKPCGIFVFNRSSQEMRRQTNKSAFLVHNVIIETLV